MSLAWSPPDDEGDARVDGYLIEMQKAGTMSWVKCNTTPSLICEYTLTNMPQGEEFKFRVMACNAGGSGEPAEVPGTVTVVEMLGMNPALKSRRPVKDYFLLLQSWKMEIIFDLNIFCRISGLRPGAQIQRRLRGSTGGSGKTICTHQG